MNNEKELFENFCFLPDWTEVENVHEEPQPRQHKDLTTLIGELEDIKNRIEDIKAHKWHLEKLIKFHQEGFV